MFPVFTVNLVIHCLLATHELSNINILRKLHVIEKNIFDSYL